MVVFNYLPLLKKKNTTVNIFRYKTFLYVSDFSSGKPKVRDATKPQH